MAFEPPSPASARIVSVLAALFATAVGLVTLAGWIANQPRLTDWTNDGIAMFVNAALCAILSGAALFLLTRNWPGSASVSRFASACVALLGALTLCEHLSGFNFGIDTLFASRSWGDAAATARMRMGPPACLSFTILGSAMLLATLGAQARQIAASLAVLPVLIAALSLTGYWFGADELYGIARFTGVALQTSTVVAILGVGLMAAIPEFGVVSALSRPDAGGTVLRRLIVPVIALPLVLGWLRILGQNAGLYDIAFGTAIRTLIEVVLFIALLWWVSFRISQHARAAAQAQSRLAAIVESSDDAIVSKSLDGVIQSWNRGAEHLFGYSAKEIVGRHITIIIPPDRLDEETEILKRLRSGQRIDHFETVRMRKDGTPLNISLTISPVRDALGNTVGASKIARDITAQKRSDEERSKLLAAEREARSIAERAGLIKDEFLATLSHELRTPLNAIYGWSQLLSAGDMSAEDTRQGLDTIQRNARMQAQLIDDLLDMSRIMAGKVRLDVQRVDLAHIVELAIESVQPTAEAKQIRLRKIIDPRAGPVSGDPTRLQQVAWNILTNAIKFTPKGGAVDILLERINSHLELNIHDSGIGIAPDFLPRIFDRFRQADASTTRSQGGLGLGLSIVKTLVELHAGTIEAKSPGKDQGSTFIIKLPLAPIRSDELREHPTTFKSLALEENQVSLTGIKVLVVDDEADARELIEHVLAQYKARVLTAANAKEALDLLRSQRPDIIVSDIGMPEKDGYRFIQEVRGLPADQGGKTPAIALTAYARSEDRTRAMLAGFQTHIAKPIEPQELIATVGNVAGGH
jgi:PAS domain S-box-containing protein